MRITVLSAALFLGACGEKEDTASALETEETVEETEEETTDSVEDTATDTEEPEEIFNVCDVLSLEQINHALPSSEEEAAQLVLIPEQGEHYSFSKEADADGWFVLEVPSWMCDVEFYTEENVQIELLPSDDWELGAVSEVIAECEESSIVLHSWTFHAWGSYIVHLQAVGETEFGLATRLVE